MRYLDKKIKKLQKEIDENFRITLPDGTSYINTTCSQGRKVTVDYFILCDLLQFYDETKKAASAVIVAREALAHTYWSKEPLAKET